MPTVEKAARTDAGLASELRLSVMRLRRRLAAERHPDNELSLGAMAVLGALYRNGELTVGELAAPSACSRRDDPHGQLPRGGRLRRSAGPHETDGRQVLVVAVRDRPGDGAGRPAPAATPGWPSGCASSPPTSAPSCARPPPSSSPRPKD